MLLQCPNCKAREIVGNISGAWWVTCNNCGHQMRLFAARSAAAPRSETITCPQCGYTEQDVTLPMAKVTMCCPACGHRWLHES